MDGGTNIALTALRSNDSEISDEELSVGRDPAGQTTSRRRRWSVRNILIGLAALVAAGLSAVSWILGPKKNTPYKGAAYECGVAPVGDAHERFPIKFYLVAIVFILFDIEAVFLYPWAVVYKEMLATHANLIFGSMMVFLGILFVGYIYALKKRAFEWKN